MEAEEDMNKEADTLNKFLTAWKNEKWDDMASLCQPSWLKVVKDPMERITAWFEFKELISFKIGKVEDITIKANTAMKKARGTRLFKGICRVNAHIVYYIKNTDKRYSADITANVVLEDDVLGVNPTSVLKEQRLTRLSEEKT